MKKSLLLLFIINAVYVFSQTEPQVSQYMLNHTAFNPAAAGANDLIQITGSHRLLWVGMPNAGSTTLFGVNSPLKLAGTDHGAGLKFRNDTYGQFYSQDVYLQYAFKKKFEFGTISVGTDLGFSNIGFRGDSVNLSSINLPGSEGYHQSDDRTVPTTDVSGIGFNLNLGVWYSSPKLYLGVSYLNVTRPEIYWTDENENDYKLTSLAYFTGGYNHQLSNPLLKLRPSVLFKTDFVSWQIDATTLLEYNEKYWGGLSYRFQDAVIVIAGLNVMDGLAITYSFDIITSKVAGWGSHELSIIYEFDYVFGKSKNKYKSIRIL